MERVNQVVDFEVGVVKIDTWKYLEDVETKADGIASKRKNAKRTTKRH